MACVRIDMYACIYCAMHTYHYYSDPYVKMSFRGDRLNVYPHFTTLSSDPVPEYYKTKTIPKVVMYNF